MSNYEILSVATDTVLATRAGKADAIKFAERQTERVYVMTVKSQTVVWESPAPVVKAKRTKRVDDPDATEFVCTACLTNLPPEAFGKSMGRRRPKCKECVNHAHKVWRTTRELATA